MSKFGFFIAAAGLVAVSTATASAPTALMAGFGWDNPAPTAPTATTSTTIAAAAASPAGFGWDSTPTNTAATAINAGATSIPALTGSGSSGD